MKPTIALLGLSLVAVAVIAGRASDAPPKSSPSPGGPPPPPDGPPKPIVVIGDSFAVGIAAQLHKLYPGRSITSYAKVGAPSVTMKHATDDDVLYIVSAGTNDAAAHEPDEAMVENIWSVLGPYASGSAKKGKLYYFLPHYKMGGLLGARCEKLDRLLVPAIGVEGLALQPNARFDFDVIDNVWPPEAADGIHFSPAGYEAQAREAMRFLDG